MRTLLLAAAAALAALALSAPALAVPPVAVTGFVTDSSGEGIVGAEVFLFDEPVGDGSLTQNPVATAISGLDGFFSLPLGISQTYIDYANSNGMANFDVVAYSGTAKVGYWAVSRIPDPVVGRWLAESTSTGDGLAARQAAQNGVSALVVSAVSPYQDAAFVPIHVTIAGKAADVQAASARLRSQGLATQTSVMQACITTKTPVASQNKAGVVGNLHLDRDTRAWFTYGQKADSDIGVGQSTNGTTNWSLSGSRHIGTSRSASVTFNYDTTNSGATFGRKVQTNFKMVKRKHQLWCPILAATWYVVRADAWHAGTSWGENQSQFNNKCRDQYEPNADSFVANSAFDRTNNNYTTYTLGVQVFGANLTTQSGAGTYVHTHWRFGNDYSTYWLCGDTGHPPQAKRIYAAP